MACAPRNLWPFLGLAILAASIFVSVVVFYSCAALVGRVALIEGSL